MTTSIKTNIRFQLGIIFSCAAFFLIASDSRAADSSAQPVDLTGKYPVPISVLTNGNWLALKTMPVGHQIFHHVPLEIGGEIHLWGEGKGTNHYSSYPEKVSDIAVNRKFEALYVYHGSYYKSPDGTPVFKVVLRYEDGSSATNTLSFGADILDWMVSPNEAPLRTPYATNSEIAWVGGQFSDTQKNRLRFCLTALNNPHPDRTVSTIDLISCKTRTIPFVLAMTTGPAGLLNDNAAKH